MGTDVPTHGSCPSLKRVLNFENGSCVGEDQNRFLASYADALRRSGGRSESAEVYSKRDKSPFNDGFRRLARSGSFWPHPPEARW